MLARCLLFSTLATATATAAPVLPDGFERTPAYGGATFSEPVGIAFTPDGRHLIVERDGIVRVALPDGTLLPTPFIDLSAEVCGVRDLGLLGLALSPDYEIDPWVYLLYTVDPEGGGEDQYHHHFSRLTRYRPSVANPDVADMWTREVLIGSTWGDGIPSPHESHSVGTVLFAEDGSLILSSGEGAHYEFVDAGGFDAETFLPGRSDPIEDIGAYRARSLNSMAGKILRVDPETGLGLPSNPFWDGDGDSHASRIWAYGLRNPYRFTLRPGTGASSAGDGDPGTLYVGDVGWDTFEELNIVEVGGVNLGWPCYEGIEPTAYVDVTETFTGNENVLCDAPSNPENPSPPSPPAYWWSHGDGALSNPAGWRGWSSTGGVFYTGGTFPPFYHGLYLQADYVAQWIRAIELDADDDIVGWSEFGSGLGGIVGLYVEPASGDLMVVDWFDSRVHRIAFDGPIGVGSPGEAEVTTFAAERNPFRATTTLSFTLTSPASVGIRVYDVAGREVRRLVDAEYPPGRHHVVWDGTDDSGLRVAAGAYAARLTQGRTSRVVRLVRRGS